MLTWPLSSDIANQVPGTGPDDNMMFLWNFWWMRHALSTDIAGFFHTPFMFHPQGVDIVLHTHTALNAFVGATVLGGLPLPVALNLTILASCALNGFSAYLLAFRASAHRLGSIAAGVFFAASPALVTHLFGHFNFYSAWSLILFTYALVETMERGSWRWATLAAVLLAAVAYTDYYFFVYSCVFVLCVLFYRWVNPTLSTSTGREPQRGWDRTLLAIAVGAGTLAAVIGLTGGFVLESGSIRISLRTGTNVRALATAAVLWWLWRRWRPTVTGTLATERIARDSGLAALVFFACAVLMAPLLDAAFTTWRNGDYVSQTYFWRSAPAGVDPATLVTGNPFNGLWGRWVMELYADRGMNAFAGSLWLGVVPIVLLATRKAWIGSRSVGLWLFAVAVFLGWALGPYLVVFGLNTGLPLPQLLMRFVPIVSNARIPGHAIVFVILGVSVLLAMAIAASGLRESRWKTLALIAFILVDFCAAPFPMHRLDAPPVYERLAALPMGGVLEVPFGFRDGFGEEGRFGPSALYYQSIHEKPIVGGYIARLPPSVRAKYHESPVLDSLIRLSANETPPAPLPAGADARTALRSSGVRYVVVNAPAAPPAARDFVMSMRLRLLMDDGTRQLYTTE